jgi:50S ribosomal protein L16 3-hydroxylase
MIAQGLWARIRAMDVNAPTVLLAGLSPAQFMRRHWQKKPLLVRKAWPGVQPPASRTALFQLAGQEGVESRLIVRSGDDWLVRHGPMPRRLLPPLAQPGWTLLVQGLDLHLDAARAMLDPFRFVPEARLDDLMVSWASDGGGVGPHVDAYDVFLLQVAGRRRWRVSRPADAAFIEGLPLKILQRFDPEFEWELEPGDLLYLPPLWGHDGVASGACMTCSIGFRAPESQSMATDLLQRLADTQEDDGRLYRDPSQPATATPGAVPEGLLEHARRALQRRLAEPQALERALGESLSEPKPQVWFPARDGVRLDGGVMLDRRTRMLYDSRHVYINGESFRIGGRDARLMRALADRRQLDGTGCEALSAAARHVVQTWLDDGWLQPLEAG